MRCTSDNNYGIVKILDMHRRAGRINFKLWNELLMERIRLGD
jgi:hypothetical protein